jgi:hypothetical protein
MRLHKNDVLLQVVSLLLVTAFVVSFEMVLYVFGVVPAAKAAIQELLHGKLGVRPTNGLALVDVWLGVYEVRERKLVEANNAGACLRGLLIACTPLLLVIGIFLGNQQLRAEPMPHTLLDLAVTIPMLVAFQVTFFFMGLRWLYPDQQEIISEITDQYQLDKTTDGIQPPMDSGH